LLGDVFVNCPFDDEYAETDDLPNSTDGLGLGSQEIRYSDFDFILTGWLESRSITL
jgi:hypothetical protein